MWKRSYNNLSCWKNLRMEDMKQRNTQRERERGTKRYISINKNATVTNEQQPLQKVTKSLYIVTHLGQLPFMLITQMARTWALKEDSLNTSIIHWYSTSGTVTGATSRELMTRHLNRHTETSLRGNNWRAGYCTASHLVWVNRC